MLADRRYRSMSPAGRQSLQFYNEYIKWWPSANNFQYWKLLASAHHLIKPHCKLATFYQRPKPAYHISISFYDLRFEADCIQDGRWGWVEAHQMERSTGNGEIIFINQIKLFKGMVHLMNHSAHWVFKTKNQVGSYRTLEKSFQLKLEIWTNRPETPCHFCLVWSMLFKNWNPFVGQNSQI